VGSSKIGPAGSVSHRDQIDLAGDIGEHLG
jgi:hypothetical protein